MNPPRPSPPLVGVGYDTALGWYVWFGTPPQTMKIPLKPIEQTARTAGRFAAANSVYIAGGTIIGLAAALIHQSLEKNKAEKGRQKEKFRADQAELDRDEEKSERQRQAELIERGDGGRIYFTEEQISHIKQQQGIDSNKRNIAICGRVSSGKSAFVNAVRGLPAGHPNLAPVGIEETTATKTPYTDPTLPEVVWWDLPGTGGLCSREWDYYLEQCVFAFDQVIIVHDQIFSKTECNIYRSCIENDKEVFIVRTQSDVNLMRIHMTNDDLDGINLINHFVSSSVEATERSLRSYDLPHPPNFYHVTVLILTWTRNPAIRIRANPMVLAIDERRLLIDLAILHQNGAYGINDENDAWIGDIDT